MKLPSVHHLKEDALDTFTRFPFAIFSAFVATAAAIIINNYDYSAVFSYRSLVNIYLIGYTGISLFTALQFIAERTRWKFSAAIIGKIIFCMTE